MIKMRELIQNKLDKIYSKDTVIDLSKPTVDAFERGLVRGRFEVLQELLRDIEEGKLNVNKTVRTKI